MEGSAAFPAQVLHPHGDYAAAHVRKQRAAEDTHLVFFFGDHSFVWYPSRAKLWPFREHFEEFSRKSRSKVFLRALEEAAREEKRLAREGEQFGYRVIPDDELSSIDDTSASASSSTSQSDGKPSGKQARKRKQPRKRKRAQPQQNKLPSSSSSSSSSNDDTPLSELDQRLPAKSGRDLAAADAKWAGDELVRAVEAENWPHANTLLQRLDAATVSLGVLRDSGIGRVVKRASKASDAPTSAAAKQLMKKWVGVVKMHSSLN